MIEWLKVDYISHAAMLAWALQLDMVIPVVCNSGYSPEQALQKRCNQPSVLVGPWSIFSPASSELMCHTK